MEERRPDPDQLLHRTREEEERKREGQLKIFFGAAPGVGKTYAMLEAARQKRSEGIDVVVGLAETHSRRETEALLEGLEILPRRNVEYRGTALRNSISTLPSAANLPFFSLMNPPIPMLRAHATRNAGRISMSCSAPASPSTPQ